MIAVGGAIRGNTAAGFVKGPIANQSILDAPQRDLAQRKQDCYCDLEGPWRRRGGRGPNLHWDEDRRHLLHGPLQAIPPAASNSGASHVRPEPRGKTPIPQR